MQEKVAIDRQSSKAEGSNKVFPANQEQADCRSAVVAHIDLHAGRGVTQAEDGHHAAGSTSFFRGQVKGPNMARGG